ncbi:LCP family protein [Blastococcus atacamensis]|uniref:LCP family protein n=1 Tax=Blastococcus atacamensis TaxID=2070508 RepID=UPI001E2A8854|nr:LCP family protein [Blastococcus atacamensis]
MLLGDAGLLASRVDRMTVDLHPGPGTTWVLVGLDSRADLPDGASEAEFGSARDVPGSRADIVLVVHESDAGATTVVPVPRDLLVQAPGGRSRLALTWLEGPQETVDALCGLGIPSDHLVAVDLAGFVDVVDAAGGLTLDVPETVRDPLAGLHPIEEGTHEVDGRTALALVRSRHPEHLVDGRWVPAPVDPDARAEASGAVLQALVAEIGDSRWSPLRLQRLAWAASGSLTVDEESSIAELASLSAVEPGTVTMLPTRSPDPAAMVRFPDAATREAVAAAGLSCSG